MNKLRNLKNRSAGHSSSNNNGALGPSSSSITLSSNSNSCSNGNSPTTTTNNSGGNMFTKLTKRYANVKFLRSNPGRQGGASAQPVSTGSYDFTTAELKREIGAPILISKTCIDMDTTDCRVTQYSADNGAQTSTTPGIGHGHKSLPTSPTVPANASDEDTRFQYVTARPQSSQLRLSNDNNGTPSNPMWQPSGTSTALRKNRSKSASNLHKSELRVFLQRAPSLKLEANNNGEANNAAVAAANCTYEDIVARPPSLSPPPPTLRCLNDNGYDHNEVNNGADNSPANSQHTLSPQQQNHHHRKSTSSSTSSVPYATVAYANTSGSVASPTNNKHNATTLTSSTTTYGSRDSLNLALATSSREPSFSRDSLAPPSTRSASASPSAYAADEPRNNNPFDDSGGLNAQDLFRSIEELSAITQQLNESDEFAAGNAFPGDVSATDDDRAYCEHRDQLRPDQRRITLLRNKGSSVLNLHALKREKLGNAWSGLKTWIGEEGGRIKEVVNKHAALQRVGAQQQPRQLQAAAASSGVDVETAAADAPNSPATADAVGLLQTLARKGSKQSSAASSRSAGHSEDGVAEGQNGFEELRRYVKQGGDFGKDLACILQERVDAELLYAKSLSKMASKLNKACRDIPGSLAEGWRGVAAEMESRSEVHRLFSTSMVDEIVKPLKSILENQHKTRKAIENAVDKSARVLAEWRTTEAKAKKSSHTAARDNEKVQDAMLDVRIQRSPSVAMLHHQVVINHNKSPDKEQKIVDKDCAKLDNKRRKAEESVKRADVEYYTLCIRAERARVEWEMSVLRGATILQSHENQRLASLKTHLGDYLRFSQMMNPSTHQICERLTPYVQACNVQKDLTVIKNIRRASEGPSEQLLPDFYCEHTTLAMNRERRKHALVKLLQLVRTDLDRERKSRTGLQVIAQSLNTPDNQNVADKLYHIRSMLTYLEGARFKLQSALLELDHKPRGAHPLAAHIQITRDRTGLQQSILKVPQWLRNGDDSDRLNEEFAISDAELNVATGSTNDDDDDSDTNSGGGGPLHAVQNNVLIKHFDRNFKRSQSNLETASSVAGTAIALLKSNGALENGGSTTATTNNKHRSTSPTTFDRGQADGGSNQPDSDFDEFSSQDEDDELGVKRQSRLPTSAASPPLVLSRCRAIYTYEPKLYDELELSPGDLIDVHAKQEDGWWMGELNKKIGIFPATYVEELP